MASNFHLVLSIYIINKMTENNYMGVSGFFQKKKRLLPWEERPSALPPFSELFIFCIFFNVKGPDFNEKPHCYPIYSSFHMF